MKFLFYSIGCGGIMKEAYNSRMIHFDKDEVYSEVAALFDICSLYRDYPRDFIKSEYPDWVNNEIGLEIALAVAPETLQRIDCNLGSMRLEEIVRKTYKEDGCILFKYNDEGQSHMFFYDLKGRFLYIPGKKPVYYDDLSDEDKNKIKCAIPGTLSNHLLQHDSACEPFILGFEQFRIKTRKLQNYQERKSYHLYTYSDSIADRRLEKSFLEDIIDYGKDFDRQFDVMFLGIFNGIYKFDLKNEEINFTHRQSNTFDSYYQNIHNPHDWQNYSFKDVMVDVPDLRCEDSNNLFN